MCGIAGIITSSKQIDIEKTAQLMAKELINRGPDSSGLFFDKLQKYNIIKLQNAL